MPGLPLARYLLVAYAILIAYASLYPFSRWSSRGANPFAFLLGALPAHITSFDVIANVVGYMPLGCLWLLAARPGAHRLRSITSSVLASATLSVVLEALQSYLPDRVASNVDCLLNVAGGLLGALVGALWAPHAHASQSLLIGRHRWFRAGARVDMGLVVLSLWLFAQLNPTALLFGLGSGFGLQSEVPVEPLSAEMFVRMEAAICVIHLIGLGLFVGVLTRSGKAGWLALLVLVVLGLSVRTAAFGILFAPKNAFAWATPGALQGLAIGLVVLLLQRLLDDRSRIALAVVMFAGALVLVNLAPTNPYTANSLNVWRQGHFLNFHGLTGFVTMVWPIVTLVYLLAAALPARTREASDQTR